jgi:hypothetical protein
VPHGTTLGELIMERDQQVLGEITLEQLNGEWIGKLAGKLNNMLTRVKRVHFKSMGGLLQLQEKLMQDGRPLLGASDARRASRRKPDVASSKT